MYMYLRVCACAYVCIHMYTHKFSLFFIHQEFSFESFFIDPEFSIKSSFVELPLQKIHKNGLKYPYIPMPNRKRDEETYIHLFWIGVA